MSFAILPCKTSFIERVPVTGAGSGVPRIIRLLREKAGHELDLRLEGNEFVVVLTRTSSQRATG